MVYTCITKILFFFLIILCTKLKKRKQRCKKAKIFKLMKFSYRNLVSTLTNY